MAKRKTSSKASSQSSAPRLFLDPFDYVELLGYFHDIAKWHGFVRFLGLPHLRENPDQPIYELYVEPYLTRTPLHPDQPSEEWLPHVETTIDAVLENRRLIILGDPGSGKSTLTSWIAVQLSQPQENSWRQSVGPLVPFPIVLRELRLDPEITWTGLIKAFLAHAVADKLRSFARLRDLMELGQVFFLLDGLDEIGSLETRKALKEAVFEGARLYPACRFLLTSRVVGYDEVSFDRKVDDSKGEEPIPPRQAEIWGERRYVAPFSDEQIQQFAQNWYSRREAAEALRETGASDLVAAIHSSEATLRLARNPNLLTLMALIHRVQRRLPHGRALLFEKIAEAYLESIDAFRGVEGLDYSLLQKKRWLGYVGFQMQLQRSRGRAQEELEILVDHETVCRWFAEAMKRSIGEDNLDAARKFVDYIGRRSGLLLPRGEGLFAFTHLSFQEYFAAFFLSEQVTSPRWTQAKALPGAAPADLQKYVNSPVWHETLVLLFELLADRRDWLETLIERLFGHQFGKQRRFTSSLASMNLLADLSTDPYSGLSRHERASAWEVCWFWDLRLQQNLEFYRRDISRRLLTTQRDYLSGVWAAFQRVVEELAGNLEFLRFPEAAVLDMSILSNLLSVRWLDLSGASISDASVLSGLTGLETLDLSKTSVSDVSALSGLTGLESLNLSDTPVSDVSALSGLVALESLDLSWTPVSDVSVLAGLTNLRELDLAGSAVLDVSALSGLINLELLSLSSSAVSDVSALSGLLNLLRLDLSYLRVMDLLPLAGLTNLHSILLRGVDIQDFSPLFRLPSLQRLVVSKSLRQSPQLMELREARPEIDVMFLGDAP
jgi:internalin A